MNLVKIAEEFGITLVMARNYRAMALLSFIEEMDEMIEDYTKKYERGGIEDWPHLEMALISAGWNDAANLRQKAMVEVKWLLRERTPQMNNQEFIDNLMIESARNYPIENLIDLKRGKALCPFHAERTPSFSVFKNRYHCFGCGAGGDAIQFVMETRGLTFKEAVRALA